MQAMILAAGYGTRLRPHSMIRPKPLFPVMGRPLILHLIDRLQQAGFARILVNCHHLASQFHDLLGDVPGVFLQDEEIELGTGGGLRRALDWFGGQPVLVMNGDIFHDYDPAVIFRAHMDSGAHLSMVVHDFPRFNNVMVDERGRITGFRQEKSGGRGRLLAFTGIQVVDPGILSGIEADRFCDLIDYYRRIVEVSEIMAWQAPSPVYWRDMGTESDYLGLHDDLFHGRSASFRPGPSFMIDPAARVDGSAELEDWAVVGRNAVVGRGCRIARSVVWDGARLEPGTVAQDRVVSAPLAGDG